MKILDDINEHIRESREMFVEIYKRLNTHLGDDLRLLMIYECVVRGVSLSEFARLCGLAPIQLTKVMNGAPFTPAVVNGIVGRLGYRSASAMLEHAGEKRGEWIARVLFSAAYLDDCVDASAAAADFKKKMGAVRASADSLILPLAKTEIKSMLDIFEGVDNERVHK